jgi:hypothetical protein
MTVIRSLALLALALSATACALDLEPMEHPQATEMRPGAGLFSGEDGEFVIYRR